MSNTSKMRRQYKREKKDLCNYIYKRCTQWRLCIVSDILKAGNNCGKHVSVILASLPR